MVWARNGTSNTLASEQDDMDITDLSGLTFNQFLIHKLATGSGHVRVTFNNDGTSSYAGRSSYNGGTDSTYKSDASFRIDDNGGVDGFGVIKAIGISGEEQLAICHWISANTAGSQYAPTRFESVFKLDTGGTITRIDLNNPSTGGYLANSNLSALGADVTEEPILGNDVQSGSRFEATDTRKIYYGVLPSATYESDFSSSTDWTQTGSNITINTGTNSLTWIGDRTTSSHGLHHDLGSGIVSSKWVLEFDFVLDNYSAGTAGFTHQIGVMLTDVNSTSGTYGSDATRNFIGMKLNWRTDTASQQRKFYIIDDNGGTDTWADNAPANTPDDSTAQSFPTAGTTYHMKLIKDGGSHSLEIWNSSQTSLLDTLNGSNSTTADIRYILVQSYNSTSTDGNPSFDGKIQNMKFYNGVTSTTDFVWTEEV